MASLSGLRGSLWILSLNVERGPSPEPRAGTSMADVCDVWLILLTWADLGLRSDSTRVPGTCSYTQLAGADTYWCAVRANCIAVDTVLIFAIQGKLTLRLVAHTESLHDFVSVLWKFVGPSYERARR